MLGAAARFVATTWVLSLASLVNAQTQPPIDEGQGGALPTADAYGNAQPFLPERRSLGIYQNEAENAFLHNFPLAGYRSPSRGTFLPFSLIGDLLTLPQGMSARPTTPLTADKILTPPARREAFARYGGFGRRATVTPGTELSDALGRRYNLISATSLNSPVHRAKLNGGGLFSASVPLAVESPSEEATPSSETASSPTLDERLAGGTKAAHDHAMNEGWAAFKDRRYRLAARAFETSYSMDPTDIDAKIGEIFSYATIGSVRTAAAALKELMRDAENPFHSQMNMVEKFGRADEASRLGLSALTDVNKKGTPADLLPLYTFTLWYLGRTNDAVESATSLAKSRPEFRDWVSQMNAARPSTPSLSPGQ